MAAWPWRRAGVDERRWLVLDVGTSAPEPARERRLLAIAAVAVHMEWGARRLALRLADSFEVVVRQDAPGPRDDILLHRIGVQRQMEGVPAADALQAFARFAGASPLLAFGAAFDQALIGRCARAAKAGKLPNRWLDIGHLCAVTHPRVRARSLDEWLAHFGIRCAQRHQAIADALAEAELLLRIGPRIAAECANWAAVERLAARHRWIVRD